MDSMSFFLAELHRASESNSHERRLAAITSACADFDHADTPRHNRELQNGVARILAKFLATEEGDDGTQKGCAALEMVFRAQPTYAHVAFDKCGSLLIPTLMKILEKAEAKQMKYAGESNNQRAPERLEQCLLTTSRVLQIRLSSL